MQNQYFYSNHFLIAYQAPDRPQIQPAQGTSKGSSSLPVNFSHSQLTNVSPLFEENMPGTQRRGYHSSPH